MAEMIHSTHNMMTKARNPQGDGEEGIEDDYDSIESLREQHQDYVEIEESSNTLGTVRSQQPDPVSPPRCQIRGVVVLLVLLSFAILAAVVRLAAHIMLASLTQTNFNGVNFFIAQLTQFFYFILYIHAYLFFFFLWLKTKKQ